MFFTFLGAGMHIGARVCRNKAPENGDTHHQWSPSKYGIETGKSKEIPDEPMNDGFGATFIGPIHQVRFH